MCHSTALWTTWCFLFLLDNKHEITVWINYYMISWLASSCHEFFMRKPAQLSRRQSQLKGAMFFSYKEAYTEPRPLAYWNIFIRSIKQVKKFYFHYVSSIENEYFFIPLFLDKASSHLKNRPHSQKVLGIGYAKWIGPKDLLHSIEPVVNKTILYTYKFVKRR